MSIYFSVLPRILTILSSVLVLSQNSISCRVRSLKVHSASGYADLQYIRNTYVRSNKIIGNVVMIPLHESSNVCFTLTALGETLTWEARGKWRTPKNTGEVSISISNFQYNSPKQCMLLL